MKFLNIVIIAICFNITLTAQDVTLVMPLGHAQKINHIEVSHDFVHIASVDDSNLIHIWDTKTQREIYQLNEHPAGIVNIDFHPSKNELVSSDQKGNVIVWRYLNTEARLNFSASQRAVLVTYSLDGSRIITAGEDSKISIWNAQDGKLISSVEIEGKATCIDVASNDNIAIGSDKGILTVLSGDLKKIYSDSFEKSPITTVTFYEDKNKLFMGHENGMVSRVNVNKKELTRAGKIFDYRIGKIIVDSKTNSFIASGKDKENFVKFFSIVLDDQTPRKFKWNVEPKDDLGLKGLAWTDTTKTSIYVADHDNNIRTWDLDSKEWVGRMFRGTARSILDIDLDSTKRFLTIATKINNAKIYDLSGAVYPRLYGGHSGGIIKIDFHHNENLMLVSAEDEEIKIWDTDQETIIDKIKKAGYLDFDVQFVSENSIIRRTGIDNYEIYNFRSQEKTPLTFPDVLDCKVSPNGRLIAFRKANEIIIYDSKNNGIDFRIMANSISDMAFTDLGIIVKCNDGTVKKFNKSELISELTVPTRLDKIFSLPNEEFILYASIESDKKIYSMEYYSSTGVLKQKLESHTNYITRILNHHGRIISSSIDGTIKFWLQEKDKFTELGTFIPLYKDNFVVTTPGQLFDASPDAMSEMHYTRGKDIISLDQLKDVYYEPNLLQKLLGYSSGKIRETKNISTLGIYPELEITHPNLNNGKLGIKITDKGGGIGRVVLNINGKEVANDVRAIKDGSESSLGIEYDIQGHPYMYDNKVNKITIKAYNKDGTLGSEPHSIFVLPTKNDSEELKPKIFALIIGSSDYANDELDLKYAAKDAQDFAAALRISSTNLIGGDNLNMKVLTTSKDKSEWPTKENIKNVFEGFALEAKARDYLIVYMAGHGVTGGENGDFYYLTCSAKDGAIGNEETRNNHAVSSTEFTEWIKKVSALKQVMIVDACHSGTLTSSFGKTMDSDEVKALEKMKDRTGLFLLAGSAADAVSYETTLYGQGLLTYALLFGLKGAALREGEYVDVLNLFQFAATKVPQLAQDIGGVQRPEVRIPSEVSSFDIGKMTDENKQNIILLSPKPVFIHTNFQDIDDFQDVIGIGSALDTKLSEKSKEPNAPLVYMNENKFAGALQVRGRYENKDGLIIVDVKVFKDGVKKSEFKTQGTNKDDISDKIMNRLLVDYK